ncbi:hypothetical protein ACFWOX_34040 [Streptomyces sp. NPDC058467]|uniref:hypothetical protein n=1 Tax=Streptomyces sp. NPDC058467 TaxID=3346513 RepID=UPI00364D479A
MPVPIETPFGPLAAVADWLRANGIDPDDVPLEGPIAIERDRLGKWSIRYAALLRNEAGHRYVDPATDDAAREERTTPLKVDPPANVQVTSL